MKIESVIWAFLMLVVGLGPGWCVADLGFRYRCMTDIWIGLFTIATGVISCITFLWVEYENSRH
jgi:hypothetical protein